MDQPEPGRAAHLLRGVEQQLHAEADAKEWRSALDAFEDDVREAELSEVAHRLRERPHARQHQPIGGAELVVVAGDGRACADVLERLLDRATIPHAVVDDGDAGHVSVPFVLGTPRSVASSAVAARSARAAALNAASIV